MRRVFAAAVALVVALSCAAAARPAATFVLKGHGWGHGIGLAQYGAYGFAQDDQDYAWILDHYYRGTELGTAGVGRVRVLLAGGARSISVGSPKAFTVRDANGRTFNLAAGAYVLGPNLRIRTASGQLRTLAGPIRFSPGEALLRFSGHRYRGLLRVRSQGGRVSAVNDVGLEQYVRGVVAWEMPSSWHPEALKAQAVVARTYGLVSRKSGWFDLYDDTRSQVYGGVRAETPSTNDAVNATRREVVRWNGELAWTLYHSTSGGKTVSREDEWDLSGMPYLASVDDPHDAISPHHTWGPDAYEDCPGGRRDCVWSAGALRRALGGGGPIRDFRVVERNGANRVERTRLSPSGRAISGGDLRSILGLRSTWFSIGVLRLTGGGSIEHGQRQRLHALVRNLSGVTLQRRVGSGRWVDVRPVEGTRNVSVGPSVTTSYRLRSPVAATAPVRVVVRRAPRFTSSSTARVLAGTATAGGMVQVQRRTANGDWVTTSVALAQEDGTWRTLLELSPGEYRAYVASGGQVETSPTLTVVAG
jgi:stage II sporulation protein D